MRMFLLLIFITGFLFTSCSCSESDMGAPVVNGNSVPVFEMANNLGCSFLSDARSDMEGGCFVYPDYYGGMYIDADGVLVVLVVGNDSACRRDVLERCKGSGFELKPCTYSMNYITGVSDSISNVGTDVLKGLKVYYWGIDEERNRLLVMTGDVSEENVNNFKAVVMDSPVIEFCKSTPVDFY